MVNRAQLYQYRGDKCSHCGLSVNEMLKRYGTIERMFELHHIDPNSKHHNYKNLMRRTISSEQIDEVDKCALLCRQCHGIIHAQNTTGSVEIETELDGRIVSQTLVGWFILDNFDNSLAFVTNEKLLLQKCWLKLGGKEEKLFFLLELKKYSVISEWLEKISHYKKIEILSFNREQSLLCIEYSKGKSVMVSMELGFPFFDMDFDVKKGSSSYLWLRNGMVLTKEGKLLMNGKAKFKLDITI
ncbi:HNH endonuclease signature motif containing protein [Vibrio parahaemolyticus]